MDAFLVDTEVNEAHSELAVLVNSLINTPVNQQSAQLVDGLSFDLKEDIGRRFAGLKNDLKTAREAGEELEEEITTLQRNIARLEATGNRHQAEHVKHHQDLLNELPIAIATGGDRVVERLEATGNRHQAEHVKHHQDLLNELPIAIATGGDRVVERLEATSTRHQAELEKRHKDLLSELPLAIATGGDQVVERLEATGNRHQAEHVKHHQDLLNELPIAIATGGDRVVERLEATSTRHQAELEKRHKDLLNELPVAIATGGNRVIELLGKGVRLQHQQTCASLKSLDSRLSELQTSQLQAVKQVQHTVSMLTEQLIQMQMKQTDEFQKAVGRFAWVIGCVAVSVLMAAGILFRVLTVHGAA